MENLQNQETFTEQSADVAQLFEALASAQGEFQEIKKNRKVTVKTKTGGQYTFRYATLDSILAATRPALSKNGLSTSSWVKGEWLTVMMAHKSGQWKASHVKVGLPNGDWQSYGSALTYSRRHITSAMLDVAADEDDDGNAACGNEITAREGDPMEAIWSALEDKGITEGQQQRDWIERVLGRPVPAPSDIKPADIVLLKETLEGKRPKPSAKAESQASAPTTTAQSDNGNKGDKDGKPLKALIDLLAKAGKDKPAEVLDWMTKRLNRPQDRPVKATKDLTPDEVKQLTVEAEALAKEAA